MPSLLRLAPEGSERSASAKQRRESPELQHPLDYHRFRAARRSGRERRALRAEQRGSAFEQNTEPKNKQRSQRHEKPVSVRGDSRPIRIAGDEKIKSQGRGEQGRAHARLAPAKPGQSGGCRRQERGARK